MIGNRFHLSLGGVAGGIERLAEYPGRPRPLRDEPFCGVEVQGLLEEMHQPFGDVPSLWLDWALRQRLYGTCSHQQFPQSVNPGGAQAGLVGRHDFDRDVGGVRQMAIGHALSRLRPPELWQVGFDLVGLMEGHPRSADWEEVRDRVCIVLE